MTAGSGDSTGAVIRETRHGSMQALADELYPWVPRKIPLATLKHACRLTGKLMLIHGDKDELIGLHHSDVHLFPSFRKAVASALGCL